MKTSEYLNVKGKEMFPEGKYYVIKGLFLSNAPFTVYGDHMDYRCTKEEAEQWIAENENHFTDNNVVSWVVVSDMITGYVLYAFVNPNIT